MLNALAFPKYICQIFLLNPIFHMIFSSTVLLYNVAIGVCTEGTRGAASGGLDFSQTYCTSVQIILTNIKKIYIYIFISRLLFTIIIK